MVVAGASGENCLKLGPLGTSKRFLLRKLATQRGYELAFSHRRASGRGWRAGFT